MEKSNVFPSLNGQKEVAISTLCFNINKWVLGEIINEEKKFHSFDDI